MTPTIEQSFAQAVAHHATGRLADAERIYRELLVAQPNNPQLLHRLGVLMHQRGSSAAGAELIARAIQLYPAAAEYHNNLAAIYSAMRRHDDAIRCCQRAIALRPNYVEPHTILGAALLDTNRVDEAAEILRRAVALGPNSAPAHAQLAAALLRQNLVLDALPILLRALDLSPTDSGSWSNLAHAYSELRRFHEAIAAASRAIALQPNSAKAHLNLGKVLHDVGKLREAIATYRRALELEPAYPAAQSNLLFALNFLDDLQPNELSEEHRRWGENFKFEISKPSDRDAVRRIRIGFVSADFWNHSVARFLLPLLENFDYEKFEIVCYSVTRRHDDVTERIMRSVDRFEFVENESDDALAQRIRDDGVDILIDLAGHTARNRLLVFARKPAPVQVSFLGYPCTTGLASIDYRISDAHAVPAEHDAIYTEKLIRLPRSAWCYEPPEEARAIEPAAAARQFTFGCFGAISKLSDALLATWAKLLAEIPDATLLIKAAGADDRSIRERVAAHGFDIARVELRGWNASREEHFRSYSEIAIALDTFPYNGTTVTCEAMYMGVPIVTLAGRTPAARVGASLLTSAGLEDLIANSAEEYVKIAAKLAGNSQRLSELRATLRDRMKSSALMDGRRFARDFESACRAMWRKWRQP